MSFARTGTVAVQIIRIVTEVLEREPDQISPSLIFADQAVDSMKFLEIMTEVERHFRIRIQEQHFPKLKSVGHLISFVEPLAAAIPTT